jgi:hypothetical protein
VVPITAAALVAGSMLPAVAAPLSRSDGAANVWRIVLGQAPEVFVDGLTAVVDLAFGPDGSLYVWEFSTDIATFSPLGAIVRIRPNGRRTVLGEGSLFFPGGVAVSRRGRVFVSNWSILPAGGGPAPFPPDARAGGAAAHLNRTAAQ